MADGSSPTKDGFQGISYTTCASVQEHGELFNRFFHLILNREQFNISKTSGNESTSPASIHDIKLNFDTSLAETTTLRTGIDDTIQVVEQILSQIPDRSHPYFISRYGGGIDPHGIIGDILATILSSPVCTYLACPVFTLMEETFKRALSLLIWNEDKECHGDGTLCPGGEFALVLAIRAALYKRFPVTKENGFARTKNSAKYAIFISQDGNRFAERACILTGLGVSSCHRVRTDEYGRLDPGHLIASVSAAKKQGMIPFFMAATIGTSNLGGIDPIQEIAQQCQSTGMWLHVDGSDAGGYIFSEEFRATKLKGVAHCESFCLGGSVLGLACTGSVLVTRTNNNVLFKEAFSVDASDTYDPNNLYDYTKYDNGNNTLQTCRRPEILPYWFLWKGTGTDGLGYRVEHVNCLAQKFHELLEGCPQRFQLLSKIQQTTRLAFTYIPKTPWVKVGSARYTKFMRRLAERLCEDGGIVVSIDEDPTTHFVVSFSNYILREDGLAYILQMILHLADLVEQEMFGLDPNPETDWKLESSSPTKMVETPLRNYTVEIYKPIFLEFFSMIQGTCLYFQNMREDPSFVWVEPERLLRIFDFSLQRRINSEPELFRLVREVILYSAHQGHPYYVFQVLAAGLDPIGIIGDMITAVAPVDMREKDTGALIMRTMEEEVIKNVAALIGYPKDCSFMLCPGGSISNMSAMTLALYRAYPKLKTTGVVGSGLNPVIFVASNGHYSFGKGAMLLGLGTKSTIPVPVDHDGRMIPSELHRLIKEAKRAGKNPFFVGSTCGTTDMGVYDRITDIARVARRHGCWLHVDAAIGGAIIMDEELRRKYLKGVQLSDSFNFNPHKWLGQPLESSIFLVKERNALQSLNTSMFWQTEGDQYDTVFQHERRPNILKFWLAWKVKGVQGMGQHIRHTLWIRDYALSALEKRKPVFQPWRVVSEVAQVCFYYLPKSLRGNWEQDKDNPEYKARLDKVAIPLTSQISASGEMMINVVKDGEEPWLVRIVVMNSGIVPRDVDYILDEIDKAGENMIV